MVQGGLEFLKRNVRQAQTRIPSVAVFNFRWFLEPGLGLVWLGLYISQGETASINMHSVSSCLQFRVVPDMVQVGFDFFVPGQDICRHFILVRAPSPQAGFEISEP